MDKNGKTTEQLLEEELTREPGSEADATKSGEEKDSAGAGSPDSAVKKYRILDKDYTADEAYEVYRNLEKDYTQKSQELSILKESKKPKTQSQEDEKPTLSERDQEVLKELKDKFGVLTRDEFTAELEKAKPQIVSDASVNTRLQIELKQAIGELVDDFDGSEVEVNGIKVAKPKVDGQKVLNFIVQNPKTELTPLQIAKVIDPDGFINYEAKQLAGNGSSKPNLPETEEAGAGITDTPNSKPLGFEDGSAEKALKDMFR